VLVGEFGGWGWGGCEIANFILVDDDNMMSCLDCILVSEEWWEHGVASQWTLPRDASNHCLGALVFFVVVGTKIILFQQL